MKLVSISMLTLGSVPSSQSMTGLRNSRKLDSPVTFSISEEPLLSPSPSPLLSPSPSPSRSSTEAPLLAPSTSSQPYAAPNPNPLPSVDNYGDALAGRCVDSTNQEYDLFFFNMNEVYVENFVGDIDLSVERCAQECNVFVTDEYYDGYVGFGVRLNYQSDNLAGRCACMWEDGALNDPELSADIDYYFSGDQSFQLNRSGSGHVSGGNTAGSHNPNWTCYPYLGNQ